MAVVISDFEVVVEPPPNDESGALAAESAGAKNVVLTPQEIELLLERQEERAARLRAH
jgi:hypothetical protein